MNRRFAAFDFDGTLVRWQLFMAIFYELAEEKLIDEADYDEVRRLFEAWRTRTYERAYEDYASKAIEIFDKHVDRLEISGLEAAIDRVFHKYKDQVYTFTRDLITDLRSKGYYLIAISGSQHEIVEKISKYYGFDEWTGTKYKRNGDKFGGYAEFPAGEKGKVLSRIIQANGLSMEGSIAIGDSEGDIPMLDLVENPVAFNPTKELLRHARLQGWQVVVERKNVVYKLKAEEGKYILIS